MSDDDSREDRPAIGGSEKLGAVKMALDELSTRVTMYGGTLCDQRVIAALSNEQVQEHFLSHVEASELFTGAYCPPWPGIPEEAFVLFEFRVLPPRISIFPTYFLVVLNTITGQLVRIIDPYTAIAARPL
jgi:hypothetical protein